MTTITRKAGALWNGNLRNGDGSISTESQALFEQAYSFNTRFGDEKGSNPEELIAAAHAACYSMALASTLEKKGYQPQQVNTSATCFLVSKEGGGFEIKKMELYVRGEVPNLDEATFKQIAMEADKGCPVSNLLRSGLDIKIDAGLM
ncbi:MAG: OsmC family protein [Anaerolineales bacterium]|jgi:osmotically inducible protein OsmC